MNLAEKSGENLKRLIKENNYTQEEFALEINRDPSTIRRWIKNGISNLYTIEYLASKLGVACGKFFL